jgi:hypothetical protein
MALFGTARIIAMPTTGSACCTAISAIHSARTAPCAR